MQQCRNAGIQECWDVGMNGWFTVSFMNCRQLQLTDKGHNKTRALAQKVSIVKPTGSISS